MKYKENERQKAIFNRNDIFRDSGNGLYNGIPRDFVLSNPILNTLFINLPDLEIQASF